MASIQCCKPAEQTCNQSQQTHSSVGQKVSQMVSSVFKKDQVTTQHHPQDHSQTHTVRQCHSTTTTTTTSGHGLTGTPNGTHQSNGKCRRNGEHRTKKRGLLQKIKDGVSGHSDDSGSSSSESDSDDDNKCGRNKN